MSPEKEEEHSSRLEFASLPPVGELQTKTRQRVIALLELLDQTVTQRAELEAQEEACKIELEALQTAAKKPGFRYGLLCYTAQETRGRRTLDKMLLMENGCAAAIIAKSYKQGAPGIRRTFKRLPEE